MACADRIRIELERAGRPWTRLEHRRSRDAHETAIASHVRGRQVAQVIVMRDASRRPVMFVFPASEHLDPEMAEAVAGRGMLRPVREEELERLFPDCDPAAIPPFGRLYGMPVVLDRCFFESEQGDDFELFFPAGDAGELIAMRFGDFRKVAGPFAHEACVHVRQHPPRPVKHGGRGAIV